MKVGLYLGPSNPKSGGGYTFENEAREALLKLKHRGDHTFVFLGWATDPPVEIQNEPSVEYISLRLSAAERAKLKKGQFGRLVGKLWKESRYPELEAETFRTNLFEEVILRKLQKHRIQFICYLAQNSCLTMEIPYLSIVWDLQHRLQPFFPEVSKGGEWSKRETFLSIYLRRASFVIAGTEAGRIELERFFQIPPERIRILPHPTPHFALEPGESDRIDILSKHRIPEGYLLYPAQFWPHKNHILILKAIHLLRERNQLNLPVVFAGSDKGNLEYIQKTAANLGLKDQIHFLGFVPREDLIALYRNAFALTYVSYFGPENLPPLEAFALNCPVIAADVSGAREQLGDAALLVHPGNEEDLANAILQLHQDPELRKKLRQAGLQRARRTTFEDFAQGIVSIVNEFKPVRACWE